MEPLVLFNGADIEVSLAAAESPVAVVAFSNYSAGERKPFGDGFLQKCRFHAVFVTAQSNHWWQSPEVEEAMAIVRDSIAHASRRVCYGNSMGGFGALAWAAGVDATHVYAVAPQTSITDLSVPLHPEWAACIDQRAVTTPDVVEGLGEVVPTVIFDPTVEMDRAHVDWLEARHPIRRLICPFAGHAALNALKEGGVLTRAVRNLLAGEREGDFRRAVRDSRVRSATYLGNAAMHAFRRRHLPMALGLTARFDHVEPGAHMEGDYQRVRGMLEKQLRTNKLGWTDLPPYTPPLAASPKPRFRRPADGPIAARPEDLHGLVREGVLEGWDGELFLATGGHEPLAYATGARDPAPGSIEAFKQNLKDRAAWAEKLGVPYVHMVTPDKLTVMGAGAGLGELRSLARVYQEAGAEFLFPVEELRAVKRPTFYRTDSHWNVLGHLAMMRALLPALGVKRRNPILREMREMVELHTFSGDLGSRFNPPRAEKAPFLRKTWHVGAWRNHQKFNDGVITVQLSGHPKARGRLLIFGDSFMSGPLPLMSGCFKEIIFCRSRFMHREMVVLARPDYLVTQNTERYLDEVTPDSEAPPMLLMGILRQAALESPKSLSILSTMLSPGSRKHRELLANFDMAAQVKGARMGAGAKPADEQDHIQEEPAPQAAARG